MIQLAKIPGIEIVEKNFKESNTPLIFKKEGAFACQIVNGNKYLLSLAENNTASIAAAILNVALTGLSLNPVLGYSYLVPFKGQIKLMPSYKGLSKLITDFGTVKNVECHVVRSNDEFTYSLGLNPELKHSPKGGDIVHAYAIARFADGSTPVIEVMTIEEINLIRDLSEAYKAYVAKKTKSCIWIDHQGEMCRKTVLKRLVKYLPTGDGVMQAISIDNEDYILDIDSSTVGYIYNLIGSSTLADKSEWESECFGGITKERANEMIEYLKNNQPSIRELGAASQTEIKEQTP